MIPTLIYGSGAGQVYGPIIPGPQMLARVLSGKREVVRLTD